MKSAQKKDFWQQHIQAWEQSKLPQKVYCQQNNISYANFGYWRTRLKRMDKEDSHNIKMSSTQNNST